MHLTLNTACNELLDRCQHFRALLPLHQSEELRNPVPENFDWVSEIGKFIFWRCILCMMWNEAHVRQYTENALDSPELDTLYLLTDIWTGVNFSHDNLRPTADNICAWSANAIACICAERARLLTQLQPANQ
jgi:hypothetical protein